MMDGAEKLSCSLVSEKGKHILALDAKNIGPSVMTGKISETVLADVTAICRRRFKKSDVLVLVELSEEEYESGIVFTDDALYYWEDSGTNVKKIVYETIRTVDFDADSVIIGHAEETTNVFLGDDAVDEKYSRYMYNFIMDILEISGVEVQPDNPVKKKPEKISPLMSMFSTVNDSLGHRMSTDKTLNMIMREVEEGIESETSPEDIAISIYNQLKDLEV